ncbi:unnamed protein product, partial [Prorocentrum cordatum]
MILATPDMSLEGPLGARVVLPERGKAGYRFRGCVDVAWISHPARSGPRPQLTTHEAVLLECPRSVALDSSRLSPRWALGVPRPTPGVCSFKKSPPALALLVGRA